MIMTAEEIIKRAVVEIGTKEVPANSNNVKYNTWFYNKQVSGANYPWCCAFISWLFRDTFLVKKTASCQDLLAWFESRNAIVKAPQKGDIVFFKYSTNARRTNHVGLVIDVQGNTITTIEGNTSISSNDNGGSVMQRSRNSNIVAFARPSYEPEVPARHGYFRPTSYTGHSIVEGLNSIGVDGSAIYRKQIADENGIRNYTGTKEQNELMLSLLRTGELKRP